MNQLQNLIHRIATDAHFRSQLQANDMAWLKDGLTNEEQNALFSLRHFLASSFTPHIRSIVLPV